MQYVDNLLDFLDKPELIQHLDGTHVRAMHYFPDEQEHRQVVAVFEDGVIGRYCSNGKQFSKASISSFILKPKEKRIIRGWRRNLISKSGAIIKSADAQPTKKGFMRVWKHVSNVVGFGPWEEVVVEVCDD